VPAELVALALDATHGAAIARPGAATRSIPPEDVATVVGRIERQEHPRWVWWSKDTAAALVADDIRPVRCWDLAAVHRLLVGGWRDDPGRVWAAASDLDPERTPHTVEPDLFTLDSEPTSDARAVRPDGHLAPTWVEGGWRTSPQHLATWADLALAAQARQAGHLRDDVTERTAHSESAAELLCAELEHDGLPLDVSAAEAIIAALIGPRPLTAADAAASIDRLDRLVLDRLPDAIAGAGGYDLRSPGQVKSLLRRVGIEVEDTRAWRLEARRDEHPIVDALLRWRKAERMRTTFGYHWLDDHVGDDGRLRGRWSGSDGAAGRMTATAGLHNLPADLRPAIVAERDQVFVRADLGQIEPRVLAAVSGDHALARATADADIYAPVATRLGVERPVAKVAVLGAMYGQTTGTGAEALRGLERAYPVAMSYLRAAADAAAGGNDLRTYGGRLVRMGGADATDGPEGRARAAARARYGRNAVVQGAAAELFKLWAVLVRARCRRHDARIVLCLHDELLVQGPLAAGDAVADALHDALAEAAARWAPPTDGPPVRFVADVSVVERWSDAT